jgi:hypothetical protein
VAIPYRLVDFPVRSCRRLPTTRSPAQRRHAPSAELGAAGDERRESVTELRGVFRRQVNFVLHTVEPEGQAFVGGLAVDVIDELMNDALGHS